ncbi:DUF434 domain-containing protein [Bacteroidota bacterium]
MSEVFISAAKDYLFLLEKNYPQKAILKLVGDRYALSGVERSMLHRGIAMKENINKRKSKLIDASGLNNNELHIDGYNVLITVGSYLNGKTLFVSNDHLLRDAAEVHGKIFRTSLMDRSLSLLFSCLDELNVRCVHFYFDKPVSKSGLLCQKVNKLIDEASFTGEADTYDSPDYQLKQIVKGCCASSDSVIIDQLQIPVIDLARIVIERQFNPNFIDLTHIC